MTVKTWETIVKTLVQINLTLTSYYKSVKITIVGKVIGLLWSTSVQITDTVFYDSHASLQAGNSGTIERCWCTKKGILH